MHCNIENKMDPAQLCVITSHLRSFGNFLLFCGIHIVNGLLSSHFHLVYFLKLFVIFTIFSHVWFSHVIGQFGFWFQLEPASVSNWSDLKLNFSLYVYFKYLSNIKMSRLKLKYASTWMFLELKCKLNVCLIEMFLKLKLKSKFNQLHQMHATSEPLTSINRYPPVVTFLT